MALGENREVSCRFPRRTTPRKDARGAGKPVLPCTLKDLKGFAEKLAPSSMIALRPAGATKRRPSLRCGPILGKQRLRDGFRSAVFAQQPPTRPLLAALVEELEVEKLAGKPLIRQGDFVP